MNDKDIFEKNEWVANNTMTKISAIMAGIFFVFWLLCMFGINAFAFTPSTMSFVVRLSPIAIFFMITPMIIKLGRPDWLKEEWYKYFAVGLLILAVANINLVLPKDGVMLWATTIMVAALYFDPKVTVYVFVFTAAMMLIMTPLSTIYGAWESNVMCTTEEEFVNYFCADGVTHLDPDSTADRLYWLNNFNEITGKAELNRWVAMFAFYFLPRFIIFSLIFKLANTLSKRTENILHEEAVKAANIQKITSELDIATNIQASMLPCIFPPYPHHPEFDIYASMIPAKEVGGDFYDFFMVDETHIAIVAADVSGKGVPAALFMVIGKTLIKDHTTPGTELAQVFADVNNILCESNSEGFFITAFEGVLDLVTGEFRYVNAGHEIPFICKKGETFKPYPIRSGFVLAGMEDMNFKAGSFTLEPGDKIFEYTDGVTEATNEKNDLFGMNRLENTLTKYSDIPINKLLPLIKKDIDIFVGDAPQFDDITMICLEFKEYYKKIGDSNDR